MARRQSPWLPRCLVFLSLPVLVVGVAGCNGSGNQAESGTGGGAVAVVTSTGGSTDVALGGAGAGGRSGGGPGTGGGGGRGTGGAQSGAASGAASGGSSGASGTSAASSQYVDAINAVRAAVTAPAGYSGTWTPLSNVAWSDTVAASAQTWANNLAANDNCGLQHESQNTYGENLAMGTNLTPAQAVGLWAQEKSLYTWSPTYSMADFDAGSGHYTQLVWRTSTQVGCGSATCGRNVVISCRFSPPGNYIGEAVY